MVKIESNIRYLYLSFREDQNIVREYSLKFNFFGYLEHMYALLFAAQCNSDSETLLTTAEQADQQICSRVWVLRASVATFIM
jgi:hypothetical protein